MMCVNNFIKINKFKLAKKYLFYIDYNNLEKIRDKILI